MDIPVRAADQPYFPNGHTQPLAVKFSTEKGFYRDWDIELRWYHTSAHDLQKRIATRTNCASFTDFLFLVKKSFAFLVRTLRELPERETSYNVVFTNRRLRYVVTFMEEVEGKQRFTIKTILDSDWKTKSTDRVIPVPF